MTYQPLKGTICDGCGRLPAEHGMWRQTDDGTRRHYCWLCYRQITEAQRRAD